MIRVEIIESRDGFEALRPEWNALHERSASRSLFLSWDWLFSWWNEFHPGKSLFLLAARGEDSRLVGIAPLALQREGYPLPHTTLRFLGTEKVSSDYLDFLLDPDGEAAAMAALWEALRGASARWDLLRLSDLLDASAIHRHLPALAASNGFSASPFPGEHCPYMPLASDGEGFRKSLGPAMRQNYRKKSLRLDEAGVTFRTVEDPEEMHEALEELYRLHRLRWSTRELPGNFVDPRVLAFHAALVPRLGPEGRMRLHELRAGERAIASLYEFQFKDVAFCYQTGFDPISPHEQLPQTKYSPGVVVIGKTMEAAIARGLSEFDFLRGPERYKAEWAKSYRLTTTLVVASRRNWRAQATLFLTRLQRRVGALVRRVLRSRKRPPAVAE